MNYRDLLTPEGWAARADAASARGEAIAAGMFCCPAATILAGLVQCRRHPLVRPRWAVAHEVLRAHDLLSVWGRERWGVEPGDVHG